MDPRSETSPRTIRIFGCGNPEADGHEAPTYTTLGDDGSGLFFPAAIDPDSRDPEKTSAGMNWYKRLMGHIYDAKGRASEAVMTLIRDYLTDTKLIFVVGGTGVGKTTILTELTGLNLSVGHALHSETVKFEVCPALIDGEQYLFIDTAGFGAADLNDMASLDDIRCCLLVLGNFVTVAGILYIIGPVPTRLDDQIVKSVRWIECFSGPNFFGNVTVVTTKWDQLIERTRIKNLARLQELLRQPDFARLVDPPGHSGACVYSHGFPDGCGSDNARVLSVELEEIQRGAELRSLIRRQYGSLSELPAKLQFWEEIRDMGIPWRRTQAAVALQVRVGVTQIAIRDGRAVVESKSADDGDMWIPEGELLRAAPGQTESTSPSDLELGGGDNIRSGNFFSSADNASLREAQGTPKSGGDRTAKKDKTKVPSFWKKIFARVQAELGSKEEDLGFWRKIATWVEVARQTSIFFKEAQKLARENAQADNARGRSETRKR